MEWTKQLTSLAEIIKTPSPLLSLLEEYLGEARRLRPAVSNTNKG